MTRPWSREEFSSMVAELVAEKVAQRNGSKGELIGLIIGIAKDAARMGAACAEAGIAYVDEHGDGSESLEDVRSFLRYNMGLK